MGVIFQRMLRLNQRVVGNTLRWASSQAKAATPEQHAAKNPTTATMESFRRGTKDMDWRVVRTAQYSELNKQREAKAQAQREHLERRRQKRKVMPVMKGVFKVMGITLAVGIMGFLAVAGARSFVTTPAKEYKKAPLKQSPQN